MFREFSALWFLKNLAQFLSALAISGHSERFSPGPNGSEVGGPVYINSPSGPPTLEPFGPGENLSEWPEIARALTNWPKIYKNHCAENPQKISRGLNYQDTSSWTRNNNVAAYKRRLKAISYILLQMLISWLMTPYLKINSHTQLFGVCGSKKCSH